VVGAAAARVRVWLVSANQQSLPAPAKVVLLAIAAWQRFPQPPPARRDHAVD